VSLEILLCNKALVGQDGFPKGLYSREGDA
jgi:hypothetical protein